MGTPRRATAPGTRDILPPESTRLREVQARVRARFKAHGFREVITPAIEYAEVVEEPKLRDSSFKLFDGDNQLVLLRPEMTTPIARLVARRLRNSPPPYKLSYGLPVYRRASVGRGQSAEFYQAGVEVVGSSSPGEDAGTIALLAEVFEVLGLKAPRDYAIVLGQTAFLEGYLHAVAPEGAPEILHALAAKDLVRVDELSAALPDEAAAGARAIPRMVGPATDGGLLDEAGRYALGGAGAALENLREILAHLEAHGRLGAVMLDLGLIGRRNYYTGAVYEVYASGLGFSVANGGRYDNLLSRFGRPMPATGFAISLERLVSVMPDWQPPALVVLVGASVDATVAARELRSGGAPVLHLAEDLSRDDAIRYARSVEAAWVCFPEGGSLELVPLNGGAETTNGSTGGSAGGSRRVPKAEAAKVVLG